MAARIVARGARWHFDFHLHRSTRVRPSRMAQLLAPRSLPRTQVLPLYVAPTSGAQVGWQVVLGVLLTAAAVTVAALPSRRSRD